MNFTYKMQTTFDAEDFLRIREEGIKLGYIELYSSAVTVYDDGLATSFGMIIHKMPIGDSNATSKAESTT